MPNQILGIVLTFLALAFAGCTTGKGAQGDEDLGTFGLPLAAEASGVTYRLLGEIVIRNAGDGDVRSTIGAGPNSANTETVSLLPGAYTIEVNNGYSCSVEPADASFTGCTYTGSAPERFVITPGRTTTVALNFTFHFDDDVGVVLRTGNANIVLLPTQDRPCGAPGCASGAVCASIDGAAPSCAERCGTSEDCPSGKACFTLAAESVNLCASVVTEIWTRQFGTSTFDNATSVSADHDGNVFVAGNTDGTFPGQTSFGDMDAFVQKFDPDGQVVWTRQFGSPAFDYATAVASDGDGSVFVVGYTWGALAGPAPSGGTDAFVLKVDTDGNLVWSVQLGTVGSVAKSVRTDGDGSLFVAGSTLGAFEGQTNRGQDDAFVLKLDSSGNVAWLQQFGTASADSVSSVAVDDVGSLFVTGYTGGALPGQGHFGGFDAFVQKLDADGNVTWTRQFGTTGEDFAPSVSTDFEGSLFVSGQTYGALPGQINQGGWDSFVQKLDGNGTTMWTQQFGTAEDDTTNSTATDSSGNLIVAGYSYGALPGASTDSGPVVRKLDSNGTLLWSLQLGVFSEPAVSADEDGNVLLVGSTEVALDGQTSLGSSDAFVKKFGP